MRGAQQWNKYILNAGDNKQYEDDRQKYSHGMSAAFPYSIED